MQSLFPDKAFLFAAGSAAQMLTQHFCDTLRRTIERKRKLRLQYLHGLFEHLFLTRGQTARTVPHRQALDDLCNLTEVARTDMLHVFAVALVPAFAFAARYRIQSVKEPLGALPAANRTDSESAAAVHRQKQLGVPERRAQDIILCRSVINGPFDHAFDHSCTVQWMNDFVTDVKHKSSVPESLYRSETHPESVYL